MRKSRIPTPKQFTVEEKKELRLILKGMGSKEDIESFINALNVICFVKRSRLGQPRKKDTRRTRERVLKDCKIVLSYLEQVKRAKLQLWNEDKIDCLGFGVMPLDEGNPLHKFLKDHQEAAWKAVGPLEQFIKALEKYHQSEVKKIGRENADSDNLIKKVGDIYIEHFGKKPTLYKDGPFFTLTRTILDMCGLEHEDPSRAIKAILKNA